MGGEDAVEIIGARDEAAEPAAAGPRGAYGGLVGKAEPARPCRASGGGIDGDHLEKHIVAHAGSIVRPDLGAAPRPTYSRRFADMRAILEGRRDDG